MQIGFRAGLRALVPALLLAFATSAGATVLYNGALGSSPVNQGYLVYGSYLTNPLISAGNQYTVGASSMTMDSTSDSNIHSGFDNYNVLFSGLQNAAFPALTHGVGTGYRITLDMQTISESHTSTNRAGFDLIALSSDKLGVELAFWQDKIFALDTSFVHAEEASFNTTAALTQYDLTVTGNTYTLTNGNTTLLTGSLRDYSASGANPNVYALPNFLFIGDDTTSANGKNTVSFLSVVPEPSGAVMLLIGAAGLIHRRRGSRHIAQDRT